MAHNPDLIVTDRHVTGDGRRTRTAPVRTQH